MNKLIIAIGLVILGVVLGFSIPKSSPLGGATLINQSFSTASSTAVSVSSTAVTVLSGNNQGRVYLSITNDASVVTYCSPSATSTGVTAGKGWRLSAANSAGSNLTLTQGVNGFTGQIWCLTSSGTSTLSVIEKIGRASCRERV